MKALKQPKLYNVVKYCNKIKVATLDYSKPYPLAKWLANQAMLDKTLPKGTYIIPEPQ